MKEREREEKRRRGSRRKSKSEREGKREKTLSARGKRARESVGRTRTGQTVTRPFGNTLLVIRIATYLGNSKPSMARPCIIGIDGERVGAGLRESATYIPTNPGPGAMRFSLPGNTRHFTAERATTPFPSRFRNLSHDPSRGLCIDLRDVHSARRSYNYK